MKGFWSDIRSTHILQDEAIICCYVHRYVPMGGGMYTHNNTNKCFFYTNKYIHMYVQ